MEKSRALRTDCFESRWVEQQLGHPVIKVFNNIYAEHLAKRGKPPGTPGRIALPVSGDDAKAKEVVMKLVNDIGFDPVDAGGLDESWRQQPGHPFTLPISMLPASAGPWLRQRQSASQSGALRPKAPAHLTRRRKTCEEQACGKRRLDTR